MSIASIPPVSSDGGRPLWSVMIPTYHPDVQMLREALAGPLVSGVDRAKMQIALVDDASGVDWKSAPLMAFAQECRDLGVEIHQFDNNIGLAGNWNRCLNLSRGHFIHVLHQDDRVRPVFYDAISAGFQANPKIGAAFTQHAFVTGEGQQIRCGHLRTETAGIVGDWLEYIFANLAIQCPAIVVKRPVYERLGGFDTGYLYCCDREMWQRIAIEYPLWFDPRPLADFRVHRGSASATLMRRSASWLEVNRCVREGAKQLSAPARRPVMRSFRRHTLRMMIAGAREATSAGDWRGAFAIIRAAASIVRPDDGYAVMRRRYDRAPFSRAPDRPLDAAARRNQRILLLSQFFPADPGRCVFGPFQRLKRHLTVLDRLGPVDAVFMWPPGGLSDADVSRFRAIAKQTWPLRGYVDFVAPSGANGLLQTISDALWVLRGFVGFDCDQPSMAMCRRGQIEQMEKIIKARQPDLIFAHRLSTAVPLMRMESKLPPMIVDVDSVRIERSAMSKPNLAGRWKARLGVALARRAQARVSAAAAGVLVCSELEQRKVQLMYPGARVFAIPNSAARFGELPLPSHPIAIFVGTACYEPNKEAILWLAEQIWPYIRRAVPRAQLIVAGEGTADLDIGSEQLGIEALGFVENLAPIYAAAMIAVCPVRRGSGTRIKIIEAAVNKRPVVSTTVGAEGLTFKPGAEILIVDDARGFADACIGLFRDPAQAALIGEAAAQHARSAYQEAWIAERLHAICADVVRDERLDDRSRIDQSHFLAVIKDGRRA
jgi:glycosyltransferase involved in cell wall biosynthesis